MGSRWNHSKASSNLCPHRQASRVVRVCDGDSGRTLQGDTGLSSDQTFERWPNASDGGLAWLKSRERLIGSAQCVGVVQVGCSYTGSGVEGGHAIV
eukprot:3926008-Pyramimonas_sp.AAC.1